MRTGRGYRRTASVVSTRFDQEDLSVTLRVDMSAILTMGLYAGPVTRPLVAENLHALLQSLTTEDVEALIDEVTLLSLDHDNGTALLPALGTKPHHPTLDP